MAAKNAKKKPAKIFPVKKSRTMRDATASLTLDGEKGFILDLLTKGEDFHWQIGQHVNNIIDQGLATQAHFPTAIAYFAKELKQVPVATLSRYGAVAKGFPEEIGKKYGCTKLAELLAYEAAAHLGPVSGDPGTAVIQVPTKGGGTVPTPFQSCSSGDLTAALAALKAPVQLPTEAAAKLASLQSTLDVAFGKKRLEAKAHLRGRKVVVQLGAFDLDSLALLADALKAAAS